MSLTFNTVTGYPPFLCLLVRKKDGVMEFKSVINYETRNESTARQINNADKLYNFKDFDWIIINTDDRDVGNTYNGLKVFSYSTFTDDYSHVCPDFLMDSWPQVQIGNYQKQIENIILLSDLKPTTNLLGWRGAITHPNRKKLLQFNNKKLFDIEEIVWDRSNPNKLTSKNYMSISDSVKKWRYFIDVEGNGWSGRIKYFLFSKRLLFVQDRPWKEWYYPKFVPWKHYIPVSSDLSDLEDMLKFVKKDKVLEDKIRNEAFNFAMNNLQYKHCLERWKVLLDEV